jgi:hypothetical protein
MKTPYTDAPLDAFLIAQSCAGIVLSATLWHKPVKSAWVTVPIFAGIWLCVLCPLLTPLASGLTSLSLAQGTYLKVLAVAVAFGTVTAALSLRWWLFVAAVVGQALLYRVSHYVTDSDYELVALHLAWLGVLVALGQDRPAPQRQEPSDSHEAEYAQDDVVIALVAFGIALLVCIVVLQRGCDSDDEWGYTWQSVAFAHGRAYLPAPPCGDALRNFWIFFSEGRAFSQYTAGWPGFMVPFSLIHAPWLAGPTAHGLLGVAVARLSRRMAEARADGVAYGSARQVRAAGFLGGLVATTGAAMVLNGASRYSHVFVAGLFAWSIELAAAIAFDPAGQKDVAERGLLLGICASWLLATRPADGATLGTGIFLLFCYAIARRRVSLRTFAATSFGFAAIAALTLVILRLQIGKWFQTGYSLTVSYYAWAEPKFSLPQPHQFKVGFPLVTTAYCFWPASVAVGFAGLFRARGSARVIAVALGVGTAALLGLYMMSEYGRNDDFGYGNRYQLPAIVAVSVGTALMLAPMFSIPSYDVGGNVYGGCLLGGPAALALFAMVSGALRIAPLVYPVARADISKYIRIEHAIEHQDIHNAMVVSSASEDGAQALDVTRNWPIPDPDVIVAGETLPTDAKCLRDHYPDRRFYRVRGFGPEVVLEPF